MGIQQPKKTRQNSQKRQLVLNSHYLKECVIKVKLSKEKQLILSDTEHNIKITAGPGSGKTTLLIEKVVNLVSNGVNPNKILLITYTNKAAEDLLSKIISRFPNEKKFYVSTFHGFCARFIKENLLFFKDYKGFKALDEYSQFLFLLKFSNTIRNNETQSNISDLNNFFGRIKDNYYLEELKEKDFPLEEAYIKYCNMLLEQRSFDFGDLIHTVIKEIKNNPKLSEFAKNKFDYIFADEYQDVNRIQEDLLKLFLSEKTKIWVVGDRNQSIYGFRGSDVTIFDRFCESFPNSKEYMLRKNYRSTKKIITFSNRYLNLEKEKEIIGNFDKEDGELTNDGVKIKVKKFFSEDEEIKNTIEYIKDLHSKKIVQNYSNIGIFFKSVKYNSQEFVKALEEANIPFEVIGDGGLLQIDYMNEILNVFKEWKEEKEIENTLLELKLPTEAILYNRNPLSAFYEIIRHSKYLKKKIRDNEEKVIFNLAKFSKILETNLTMFDTPSEKIFEYISQTKKDFLDTEQPIEFLDDSVKLLTFHRSKGLEFPIVIIPEIQKNFMPSKRSDPLHDLFEQYDPNEDFLRAKYVGITRAKDELILSYTKINYMPEDIKKILKNTALILVEDPNAANLVTLYENQKDLSIRPNAKKQEILELSHHKIEEFLKCPYSYKLRFYNNFAIPRNNYSSLTYGTVFHILLYHLNLKISNLKGEQFFSDKLTVDLDELIEEKLPKFAPLRPYIYKNALEKYFKSFEKELKNQKINPEMPFQTTISDCLIRGRIDLVLTDENGEKTIVEFKSGAHNHFTEDQAKRQIKLYSWAIKDPSIKKGIIYFFGKGGKKICFDLTEQITFDIQNIIPKIKNKEFTPNPNNCKQVRECAFAAFCPHYNKKARKVEETTDSDENEEEYDDEIEII